MTTQKDKIGVFDSGMGGLTVLSEIEKAMPNENIIYYADAKNCPYGEKTKEQILSFTRDAVNRLLKLGSKIIVIACNTATNSSIKEIREEFNKVKFIAMEPAVKPAVDVTKNGKIAVIATRSTINGESLKKLCSKHSENVDILTIATPELVELVEKNRENTPESNEILTRYFSEIIRQKIDTVVLGCTHYPFLKNEIEQIISGHDIKILDAATAVAKQTTKILKEQNLLTNSTDKGKIEFYSSLTDEYTQILEKKYREYTKSWQKK